MTGEISSTWIKDLSWARSFAVRRDLAKAYGDANSLLQDPNVSLYTLKEAFRHYFKWCMHIGLAERSSATVVLNYIAEHADFGFTWSALFRLNCQAIRYAACQLPCTSECCCRCIEAPDDMPCTGILAHLAYTALVQKERGIKGN